MFYSPTACGFYDPEIHAAIPTDAVEIAEDHYAALLEAQASGARIEADKTGAPIAVYPAAPSEAELLAAWRATAAVSRFQARAALFNAGLLDTAEAAVAGADRLTQLAWADAQEFRRASPAIAALAIAMAIDEAAMDDLFRAAALITA